MSRLYKLAELAAEVGVNIRTITGWVNKGALPRASSDEPRSPPLRRTPRVARPTQIATVSYLATLLTQVIFTASVQHAAVNFPQRTIMSYAPATPLAGFAPFPAPPGAKEATLLEILPPLNEAILQQAVMTGLGGIYHTMLGMYGGQLSDPRALHALQAFQEGLRAIAEQINYANARGERTAYTTLLPAFIPQSINI